MAITTESLSAVTNVAEPITVAVRVEPLNDKTELTRIVPLIQGYQEFYLGKSQPQESILSHFGQWIPASEKGFLLVAWEGLRPLGFCTVYVLPSSLSCRLYAHLNDLFVLKEARGKGLGKRLMTAAASTSKGYGFGSMEWITQVENLSAQKLYDRLTPEKTAWFYYAMKTE